MWCAHRRMNIFLEVENKEESRAAVEGIDLAVRSAMDHHVIARSHNALAESSPHDLSCQGVFVQFPVVDSRLPLVGSCAATASRSFLQR
jgi:hypothetical protein